MRNATRFATALLLGFSLCSCGATLSTTSSPSIRTNFITLELENQSTDMVDVLMMVGGHWTKLATTAPGGYPERIKVAIPRRWDDSPFGQLLLQHRGDTPYPVGPETDLDHLAGTRVRLTIGNNRSYNMSVLPR